MKSRRTADVVVRLRMTHSGNLQSTSTFQKPDIRSRYSANIIALQMLSWTERSSFVVGVSCCDASSPLVPARQFKRLV